MLAKRSTFLFPVLLLPSFLCAQSTVTLTATPNPSRFGAAVSLSAAVSPSDSTGRVTFYDGVTVLGTKPLASGTASLSTILLPAGTRKLKAYYSGDATHAAAGSNIVTQTVTAQPGGGLLTGPSSGTAPGSIFLVADFNGDGKADLLSNANGTTVLLGDGAGNFQPSFTQTSTLFGAITGDFNGDGISDLAVINSTGPNFNGAILLGKGDGTFQTFGSFPVAAATSSVAVGDFNGDGKADLVIADTQNSAVKILVGNGDGTFQPQVTVPGGGGFPTLVFVGDFNGDGKADIVAVNAGTFATVLLGNGDGTFHAQPGASTTNPMLSLSAADFNGDGNLDLVTSSGDVLLGKGDGTFQSLVNYATGLTGQTGQIGVVVSDFNGDGKSDLIFTHNGGSIVPTEGQLLLAIGNGDGTFQPPVVVAVLGLLGPINVVAADWNGDGVSDLAVSPQVASVSTLFGTAKTIRPTTGNPQTTTVTTAFAAPLQVTVKDGNTPLSGVTVTYTAPSGPTSNPTAILSSSTAVTNANGVASITATANGSAGKYGVTATAAGVTTEFALTNSAAIPSNVRQSPSTPQSALVGTPFPSPFSVTVTDSAGVPVSGLPLQFLVPFSGPSATLSATQVTTDANGVATTSATANYIPGNYTITVVSLSSAVLPHPVTFSLTNVAPSPIAVTLTTSPNPSILGGPVTMTATVSRTSPTARVTFYNGVTPLGSASASSGVATFATTLMPAGTNTLKALYRDDPNLLSGFSNPVAQVVNAQPGGSFLTQSSANLPPAGSSVVMGDFNSDGKVDFAYASGGSSVSVILGKGDGTFQNPIHYTTGVVNPNLLLAADFDGDGNLDIAATSARVVTSTLTAEPTLSILYGKGDGTFRPSSQLLTFGAAVADMNGDGRPDIAYANVGHNTVILGGIAQSAGAQPRISVPGTDWIETMSVLSNNGDGTFSNYFLAQVPGLLPTEPSYSPTLLVADFNGDGNPDLLASAVGNSPSRYLVLMNGDLTAKSVTPMTIFGLASVSTILTGDFNRDGIIDLAVGGRSGSNVPTTVILFGNGDGPFQPPVSYPFGSAALMGDFNGDGFVDLVLADGNGNTSGILQGSANGTFTLGVGAPGGAPLAVADLNGDGRADILTSTVVLLGTAGTSGGGVPASIAATGGTPQTASTGTSFSAPLQATVRDAAGVAVAGAIVTFSAPSSGASAALSSNTAATNAAGVASVTAQANGTSGSYTVTASIGSLSATFSLTNTPGSGNPDLALGKTATQSSTLSGIGAAAPGSAVDGNTDGNFFHGSVSMTNPDTNAWWQVDLGASAAVDAVKVWNRTDCCGSRLSDYWVFISDTPFLASDTPATLQNRTGTFASHQTLAPDPLTTILANGAQGRYVRVQLSGTDYLGLAEVEVFGAATGPGAVDVAQGMAATQSSTLAGTPAAAVAVDGITDGNFYHNSVTATNAEANAWWQVDLGASTAVKTVVIWNRTDCCASRLSDYWVFISDTPFLATDTPATLQNRASTYASHQTLAPNPASTITVNAQGRYVRIQLSGTDYLSLAEVQVFAINSAPAPTLLSQGKPATQSSTLPGSPAASVAVDGNTDGNFFDGSVTATNAEANAWWQVDLGASASISSVLIFNRTDCCSSRLSDYWVFISDTPFLPTDTPATLGNRAGTFANHQTSAAPAIIATNGAQGRYVRVQLTGTGYLSLAEVQVMGTFLGTPPPNLAAGKAASQSSTLLGSPSPGVAADGNTDGNYFHGSVTATNPDANAWWQVDLGASASIGSVVIFNRTDCCGSRLGDYWVLISDTPFQLSDTPASLQNRAGTFASHQTSAPNPSTTIQTPAAHGRYVRVQLSGTDYLSLAEVQVFGQ